MSPLPLLLGLIAAEPLAAAQAHLDHGRYEEALDAYAEAVSTGADAAAVALGTSRVRIETGRYDEAAAVLDRALAAELDHPDLLSRRGEARLLQGDFAGALRDADAALEQSADHAAAHWVRAESLTETGRIAEAVEECRWFVRYYNRTQPTDPETLVYVAKGSLQYARWKRVSSILHFTLNELCPDIVKADPDDWRSDAISGSLLLEKYNAAQGLPDLERALAKNPNAAEVHAALAIAAFDDYDLDEAAQRAVRALQINPALVAALGVKADVAIVEGDLEAARFSLDAALAVNPHDQEILARRAAGEVLTGSVSAESFAETMSAIGVAESEKIDTTTDFGRIVAELLRRNPKPGAFLSRLGATLERRRLFGEAERAYETAIEVMPELSEPQVALGLLSMRAGDLSRARGILDAAFKSDPFHIRVSNMRKVVGLLAGYETFETPHFVIRFDPEKDRVLAELAAESLEAAYPKLTAEFGFEPPGKTVVELFHDGKGQSGHEWFSARMVGLPWLQTIGASTGLMIALASPTSGQEYNWDRVLRHEFVHVITLQQTRFRVPHWYTEALAVRSEGYPRPERWDDLLRERVPTNDLRTLDDLNSAFIRPASSDDWQFAYCQSLLYAEHLEEQYGAEIHRRLLDRYARGLTTEEAIREATGLSTAAFDEGYRTHLKKVAAGLGPPTVEDDPSAAVRKLLQHATSLIRQRKHSDAIASLEAALDRHDPQPKVLELLGRVKLAADDATGAAESFALGREQFPHDRQWLKLHAAALLKAGATRDATPLLEQIAITDPDDSLAAKKLAEWAAEEGDAAATKRWAMRALHVTPDDEGLHVILAEACEKLGDSMRAATARRHVELLRSDAATE